MEFGRGDVLANRYEVVERIDEGALGIAYRVRHTQTGDYARLQLLDPKVIGRDQKDALLAAFKRGRELTHKNLVQFRELDSHQGVAFLVMDDVDGGTLRELMDRRRNAGEPFALREAAQLVMQILEGLKALHEVGIVVRGLRPENVLVAEKRTGPRGANVVYDVRLPGGPLWPIVAPGVLAEDEFTRGEAQYLAPELKGPTPTATPASDVYSVGVMFYELLVGAAPIGTWQLPRARRPDLPHKVDDIVEIALSPTPTDRYPSCADFAADVHRSFAEPSSDEPPVEPKGTNRFLGLIGVAVVAAIGGLLYLLSAQDPHEAAMNADNVLRKTIYDAHAKPSSEEVRAILAKHPPNMRYIPAGPFVAGRLAHEPNDAGGTKAEQKELGAYLIDIFETPNLDGGPPTTGLSYTAAKALCEGQGKRLCTEDEWEKACRGPENYVYSYGDTFDEEFCGKGLDDVHLAGAMPKCASSWGVYDISGNLREWTDTPRGDGRHLVKGGQSGAAARGTRCAAATDLSDAFADPTLGARCCRDVDAPPWTPPAEAPPTEAPPTE